MRLTNASRRSLRLAAWLLPLLVTMQVSAAAAASCEASVSLVDFGQLDLEQDGNVAGEVVVTYDQPGRFSVSATAGTGGYRLRKMIGADSSELKYNLFVDPARRHIWGDGVSAGPKRSAARAIAGDS